MEEKLDNLTNRTKTRHEVADEYGICVKTLNDRLKKYNIKLPAGVLFPESLTKVYKKLGMPVRHKQNISE